MALDMAFSRLKLPGKPSGFWRALKRLEVPTQLAVYANEGHGIRQPKNRRDILLRSAVWLNRALDPSP